jgi:hypothetical protein
MRGFANPLPTEQESIAISLLLLKRARAGEFGYCGHRPLGIWCTNRRWRIGSENDPVCYILDCWQAASVALGRYSIQSVPPLGRLKFERFPTMEDAASYVGAPAAEPKPAASERVPREVSARGA